MNRHQRRKAERLKKAHNDFYSSYVGHLPRIDLDTPTERGRVYHLVFHHDGWCAIYSGAACNCNPIVSRHIEPVRS